MYYILIDWKYSGEFFLETEFKKKGLDYKVLDIPNYNVQERTTKIGGLKIYYKYMVLAHKAVKESTTNDIIFCWNFTTSIAVGWICRFLNKKRKIIAHNIIAPPYKGLIGIFRNKLFSSVMRKDGFVITVNSSEYIITYSKQFNISETKFNVLHDPFVFTSDLCQFSPGQNFVFCGGEANRDWETLFAAALLIPEIRFVCVARKKFYNKSLNIPENVSLLFDVEHSIFYSKMRESSLVVIPLSTILSAGQTVLLNAASHAKPVIATSTPSIRNYVDNVNTGFLFDQGNYELLAEKIRMVFNDILLQEKLAKNLQSFLLIKHSTHEYTERLITISNQAFNGIAE